MKKLFDAQDSKLISVASRVVLGTHDQTTTFLCAAVDGLNDVDEFLLILPFNVLVFDM